MEENAHEQRVAVFVDCDNVSPDILEHALLMAAQFGRIVLRRGYGNHSTLADKWQKALVRQAFTPCLQFQYAAGKNTADIALALDAQEALFDARADVFCLVTSDSDFAYLCRKLHERGATVCLVGEAKTPDALRNASDQFFEWVPEKTKATTPVKNTAKAKSAASKTKAEAGAKAVTKAEDAQEAAVPPLATSAAKKRPGLLIKAVSLLDDAAGKVSLSALGQYLKRTDPSFTPNQYGYASLLKMCSAYEQLAVQQENGTHWVSLLPRDEPDAD
jgi:uncharacterized protein (TIGR00288 family)